MRPFHASGFVQVARMLGGYSRMEEVAPPSKEQRQRIADILKTYDLGLQELNLSASRASLRRTITLLEGEECSSAAIATISKELVDRLADETDDKVFFSLTIREAAFYKVPREGWTTAIDRFPSIVDDVEEASKCFALSRYPGAVFHSLQIVEAGLIELGAFLKVQDHRSGWTSISAALDATLKKEWKDRSSFEKRNFAFLEQVEGTVQGLKNAWRTRSVTSRDAWSS